MAFTIATDMNVSLCPCGSSQLSDSVESDPWLPSWLLRRPKDQALRVRGDGDVGVAGRPLRVGVGGASILALDRCAGTCSSSGASAPSSREGRPPPALEDRSADCSGASGGEARGRVGSVSPRRIGSRLDGGLSVSLRTDVMGEACDEALDLEPRRPSSMQESAAEVVSPGFAKPTCGLWWGRCMRCSRSTAPSGTA
mmetsp:Transcript_90066/g.218361  ORF Transcript_90066/g.218361 Transcript_90066/m.218361 type:complete len:197 (-) Transcript_90066:246-836(-)